MLDGYEAQTSVDCNSTRIQGEILHQTHSTGRPKSKLLISNGYN